MWSGTEVGEFGELRVHLVEQAQVEQVLRRDIDSRCGQTRERALLELRGDRQEPMCDGVGRDDEGVLLLCAGPDGDRVEVISEGVWHRLGDRD